MLPYVLSERAPLWDPDIPGAFLGVRHHHSRSHFIRAAVEGVCLQISTIVDALDTVSPVRSVRATGGPFRSSLWQNVMAATLARPFTVQPDAGGTALGAAALGWFALGGAPDLTEALAAVRGPESTQLSIQVSPDDVATYASLRASLPTLIAAYDRVAEVFTPVDKRS